MLVADLLHPLDDLAVQRFLNRDVSYRGRRRRAVPVLLARWKPDDIAGLYFLNRPALALRPAAARCHDQGLRAPGSNVTLAPATRAGSDALNKGSIRTVPVNQSGGPLPEGCEPMRLMSMFTPLSMPRALDRNYLNVRI